MEGIISKSIHFAYSVNLVIGDLLLVVCPEKPHIITGFLVAFSKALIPFISTTEFLKFGLKYIRYTSITPYTKLAV